MLMYLKRKGKIIMGNIHKLEQNGNVFFSNVTTQWAIMLDTVNFPEPEEQ